ncbi:hypothetical protein LTR17_016006 [Elasticomyces elasticus]|nr:hypothetical protein LTR17_016006 [Elasticomyces elasticus]
MADTEPPAKQRKYDFTEHLRVLVGEAKQEFMVHKDLITTRSPFFKAAAAARWNSDPAKDIELPDDKPAVFASYLQCLYMGPVLTEVRSLVDLYVLADKLGDLTSMNAAVDCIVQFYENHKCVPANWATKYIFRSTVAGSQLRQLVTDYWVHGIAYDDFQDSIKVLAEDGETEVCAALLSEFVRVLAEKPQSKVWEAFDQQVSKRPKCQYHQHDEDMCPPCDVE